MALRFSANNTHLYPGAILRHLDKHHALKPSSDDDILIEFSDGILAEGQLQSVEADGIVLRVPPYRTQKGTVVETRCWRIVRRDEPGEWRVQKRLPLNEER